MLPPDIVGCYFEDVEPSAIIFIVPHFVTKKEKKKYPFYTTY